MFLLGSFGGGQTVTLNGDGFSEDMTVQVCGQECKLESTSDSSPLTYECVIPSRADLSEFVLNQFLVICPLQKPKKKLSLLQLAFMQ